MKSEENSDGLAESRVSMLRSIKERSADEIQELAMLEDYLIWKSHAADRTAAVEAERRDRMRKMLEREEKNPNADHWAEGSSADSVPASIRKQFAEERPAPPRAARRRSSKSAAATASSSTAVQPGPDNPQPTEDNGS
jgi:hypothetical protein